MVVSPVRDFTLALAKTGWLLALGAALSAFATQLTGKLLMARRAEHLLVMQLHLALFNPKDHFTLLGLISATPSITHSPKKGCRSFTAQTRSCGQFLRIGTVSYRKLM